ncbi:uncharacterized protein LOC134538281 [Bacillus rossius redtenbacheri]|uniref:uncharacterized protein LOC134538281 n=1 Tax=Bacillus rossius redtenbacheri TaxID=93214 RepID=UPI002FDE7349
MTRLEENRFRSVSERLLLYYPHYIVAGNKLCKDVSTYVDEDVTKSQLKLLLEGVSPPSELAKGVDPVTELVVRKQRWRDELENKFGILRRNRRDVAETLDCFNKFATHGKTGTLMSERRVKLVKHVSKDPDLKFDGCCNWYYCGGQLNHFEIDGRIILTSAQGNKYDSLYFIPLKNGLADLAAAACVSPVKKETIFQVVSSKHGYTVARSRNHINLYKVEIEQDVIVGNKCFTAVSKEPFVSVDLSRKSYDQICSVHMDNNLSIWDVATQSKISHHVPYHCSPVADEKWSAAVFGDSPHMLFFSDRSCVRRFDLRQGLSEHVSCWCVQDSKHAGMLRCESVFSVVPSARHASRLHVGTTHHLLTLDVRNNHSAACSEFWTHMLRSPPLYGCCTGGEREALVMASQDSSEVQVFSDGSLSPAMLESFSDYLRRSNCFGHNLRPDTQQRFRLSISGVTCVTNDALESPMVLVQTAAGDIFQHELLGRTDFPTADSSDTDGRLSSRCTDTLQFSSTLEMNHLHEALKVHCDDINLERNDQPVRSIISRFPWMKSKRKLLSYRDLLVSSILDTWDIDAMEEWKNVGRKKRRRPFEYDIPPSFYKKAKQLLDEYEYEYE